MTHIRRLVFLLAGATLLAGAVFIFIRDGGPTHTLSDACGCVELLLAVVLLGLALVPWGDDG